jgi:hypothetical protein
LNYFGTYLGTVEENKDPEKLGRVKVRVPHVFGFAGGPAGAIGLDDLPWAIPAGMPAGGSSASGGISWLPESGDQVFVRFLDGEPEKPVWEWGGQSQPQGQKLALHEYEDDDGQVGDPSRSALTRYGHTIEFHDGGVFAVTDNGNLFNLDDDLDGGLLNVNEDLIFNIGSQWSAVGDSIDFDIIKSVRIKAGTALSMVCEDLAAAIETDIIVNAGNSITVMVGEDATVTVSIEDGTVSISDGSGSVFAMDGDGSLAMLSPNGTTTSVEDGKITLVVPNGASVIVEEDKVSVNAQQLMANVGSAVIGNDTASITLGDESVKAEIGSNQFELDDISFTASVGARSMTMTTATTNFT